MSSASDRVPVLAIVATEASGDSLGAALVDALSDRLPDLRLCGIGGEALRARGLQPVFPGERLAVTGIVEALRVVPDALRALFALRAELRRRRPDLIVLVDAPDFNLRAAAWLRRLGIPMVQLVGPQLWAWRPGRMSAIKANMAHVLVLFEFEKVLYEQAGVPVTWIGHPLADKLSKPHHRSPPGALWRIALMPGSRPNEVRAHLPALLSAARELAKRHPDVQYSVIMAPGIPVCLVNQIVADSGMSAKLDLRSALEGLSEVDGAWIASGTATLEAACLGVPMVIVYRTHPLTWQIGKRLVRNLRWIGLPNILRGQQVVPERIQHLDPPALAALLTKQLEDREIFTRTSSELLLVRRQLGQGGAARRAAEALAPYLAGARRNPAHGRSHTGHAR